MHMQIMAALVVGITFVSAFPIAAEDAASENRSSSQVSAETIENVKSQKPKTRDELRKAYHAMMLKSAKRSKAEPHEFIPEMVQLHSELKQTENLSHSESSKKAGIVKNRLEETYEKLKREAIRMEADIKRTAYRTNARTTKTPELNGPAQELARANELIELIQSTIEPDHWDVNGGKGSIRYFANLKVLVVRAKSDVHYQIGNNLP